MRKDIGMRIMVGAIVMAVLVAAYFVISPYLPQPTTELRFGDSSFNARIAANTVDRVQGLSGTANLAADQALIMAYPSSDRWPIWMKDMKFAIDIVWLNSNKKVVYIVKNASPENSASKVFTPKSSAQYVVELPAGSVDSDAITTDTTAIFQIDTSSVK